MSLALRRGVLAFVAVLIAEAVWIITVPPYRGSDEIDHVYRAAGVASGQVRLSQGVSDGRGLLVWVPTDIVTSAQEQCTALTYVGYANCHAVETSGDRSRVATAAGFYDPSFYWVVGTIAKPFHGATADYAMRAATALMCALLLAVGVGVMTLAGTGRWANLGVLAALTPEVMFSGAIPSPNGVEMGLAFVVWAALLAAVRQRDDARLQGRLLLAAGAAIFPLTFVRLLGPLWVVLIVLAVAVTVGWRDTWRIAWAHRIIVSAVVVTTVMGVCWWETWRVVSSHTVGGAAHPDVKNWWLAFNLPAFSMQMVGAFPFRDEPAPLGIYPLAFFVVVLMLWAAWRRGEPRRVRRAVLLMVLTTALVPVLLSLAFMQSQGAIWQGRYELPFVIGLLPLCGLVLDDVGFAPVESPRLIGLSAIFLVITHVVCVYHVQQLELSRPQSYGDPAWWHPPGVVLAAFVLVACAVAWAFSRQQPQRVPEPLPDGEIQRV